jgi:Rieske Fe-S protein
MTASLLGGYGAFALISGRYLYPARPSERSWQFVIEESRMDVGDVIALRVPGGNTVNVARHRCVGGADDFIALSSTCPHLGCKVSWRAGERCFFCPCHNGYFDASGNGTAGPPGREHQSLPRYALKVENGLLHVEVEDQRFASTLREPLDPRRGAGSV